MFARVITPALSSHTVVLKVVNFSSSPVPFEISLTRILNAKNLLKQYDRALHSSSIVERDISV